MIRLSKFSDKEGIIALWQEAFGDSREAVELFLNKRYLPQNTLVAEESGKIASMLFLLEGDVKVNDITLKAFYLYAAATLKEFRGKGIMAQMLQEAKKLAQSRGFDLICLKPAEESLYGFYEKHGYKTVFSIKKAIVKCEPELLPDNESNCTDVFTAREAVFSNVKRFVWNKDAIGFAIEQHKFYGGKVYCICEGYCLYSINDGVCAVKELCFTESKFRSVLARIASFEQVNEFWVELPLDYDVSADEISITNNGMALMVTDKSKILCSMKDLYLNLTLD